MVRHGVFAKIFEFNYVNLLRSVCLINGMFHVYKRLILLIYKQGVWLKMYHPKFEYKFFWVDLN